MKIFSKKITGCRLYTIIFLFLLVPMWVLFIAPFFRGCFYTFTYSVDLFSLDNFYDEEQQKFTGEKRSLAKLSYLVEENNDGIYRIKNTFDVRTVQGEKIITIDRYYGIDKKTGQHVTGAGDKDRSGYLFAPSYLQKGDPFTYWHINYDVPAHMEFVQEEYIHGLKVYKYETKYNNFVVDQTESLHHLPGVPDLRGVRLNPHLQLWVEPITGMVIKYKDKTEAYYYDKKTDQELAPWNTFSNTVVHESVIDNIQRAQYYKNIYFFLDYGVPILLTITALGCVFVSKLIVLLFAIFIVISSGSIHWYSIIGLPEEKINVVILRWDENEAYEKNITAFKNALLQGVSGEYIDVNFIDARSSESDPILHAKIIQELVTDQADMVYSLTTPGTLIAKENITDIPVIFSIVTYPVEAALIDSLVNSGNNLVGTRNWVPVKDQLKVMLAITPQIQSIGFIHRKDEPNSTIQYNEMKKAAELYEINLVKIEPSHQDELAQSLEQAKNSIDALYLACDTLVQQNHSEQIIIEFAQRNNLPDYVCLETGVYNGSLAGVVADFEQIGKLSGEKAVLILSGATPSSLETSTVARPYIYLNQKRADELNVIIPQDILTEAKKIISGDET